MKKIYFTCILMMQVIGFLFAQKKPLDHSTSSGWPSLSWAAISNDGKFIDYSITIPNHGSSLVIQATDASWKEQLPGVYHGSFSYNSEKIIFKNQGDSLGILDLKTRHIHYIPGVADFILPLEENSTWLVYQRKNAVTNLVMLNLVSGTEKNFADISSYLLSKNGYAMVLKQAGKVLYISSADTTVRIISEAQSSANFVFNEDGKQLAFFTTNRQNLSSLRYYQPGMDSAKVIVDQSTPGMAEKILNGSEVPFFNATGDRLFFLTDKVDNTAEHTSSNKEAKVDIRGISDNVFKDTPAKSGPILATISLSSPLGNVVILQKESDGDLYYLARNSNWLVTESNIIGDPADYKWRVSSRPDIYLISTTDGSRKLLERRCLYNDISFSLSGKYVIWFDREKRQWFAHNIASNATRNISEMTKVPVYGEDDHSDVPSAEGIAGWLENDAAVLIYDRHDIWQLDLDGVKPPVNITGAFGSRNKIKFRYMDINGGKPQPIHMNDTLLLSAFDQTTKQDGFFQMVLANRNLQKLVLSPNIYNYKGDDLNGSHSISPLIKAKYGKTYIIARMSATEYPNLYSTSNFKNLIQLTNLSPQKIYNWYTSELVHWQLPNGKQNEGILYKPENFDSHKKYPIIFYYYEQNAYALNTFIHPELSSGPMNIPWFVSNGYLVFVPDIHYQIGHPGKSACDAVVSAALYLSKKPWVDVKHMGIQGHSYGGFETNYIVTHSTLFAAAVSASSLSNLVSIYGERGNTWYYERRQGRIGATLWQRPDLYIDNSAVFKADKVSTPLLIMHGCNDMNVPYSQGLQWYNDLHRLNKKVWLLSYSEEGHILSDEKNQLDYSTRMSQFFDHYLKGAPAPNWMTKRVIPGIADDGLKLENIGVKPQFNN